METILSDSQLTVEILKSVIEVFEEAYEDGQAKDFNNVLDQYAVLNKDNLQIVQQVKKIKAVFNMHVSLAPNIKLNDFILNTN